MKKLFGLLAILVIVFAAGCTEETPTVTEDESDDQPTIVTQPDESLPLPDPDIDPIPEDFVGVWLRTATYFNGAFKHNAPAVWTLNNTNYTSTGDCINTGKVMAEGGNTVTITLDSTTCPNVPTGGNVSFTYEIIYDEERDLEVMTVYTGPMMETYDRES